MFLEDPKPEELLPPQLRNIMSKNRDCMSQSFTPLLVVPSISSNKNPRVRPLQRHEPVHRYVRPSPLLFPNPPNLCTHLSHLPVWTALSVEGLGCNLQHYQPHFSPETMEEWGIDPSWKMRAQLVFGTPFGGPRGGDKTFKPLQERVKVFGKKGVAVNGTC